MHIRRLGALAGAAALAVSLAACGSGSGGASGQSTAVPKGKVTIVWSASPIVGTGANDVRNVLIKQFEKKYPNITVKLSSAPTDTDTNRSNLTTQISGGSTTPDVFDGDITWPAQFAKAGLALPLSDYLPKSFFNGFASGLTQGASYNGKVYGSPLFVDESFLYYRKDLLTKYKLPVPTTWEQLESDVNTLKAKSAVKDGFVWQGDSYEGLTCNANEYIADAGGSIVSKDGKTSEVDSAAAKKAVTFMQSLINKGISPKAVTTYQEQQSETDFESGNAAFLRNWSYAYNSSNSPDSKTSKVIGKVGVTVLPTFQGQPAGGYSTAGGWDVFVNPHSKQLGADLAFVKFMAGTQAQTTLATKYAEIPSVQSVRTDPAVAAANPIMKLIGKTKIVSRPTQTPDYAKVSTAVYTNINSVLSGSSTPSAGLSKANSQVTTALSGGGL